MRKNHILEYFTNNVSLVDGSNCIKIMGPTMLTESLEDSDQDYFLDYLDACDVKKSLCNEKDFDVILL